MKRIFLAAIVLLAISSPAGALPLVLDYTGFSWSAMTNGDIQSFEAVGVVDGFSLPVNLTDEAYTFHIAGLALSQVTVLSSSTKRYSFSGGGLALYRSTGPANRGYDYGTNPANGTVPATFVDGVSWLSGSFDSFNVVVNSVLGLGQLNATGSFGAGEFAPSLLGETYFTFAGLTSRPGNGIPAGYSYRMDGQATSEVAPVPEPAGLFLLGAGILLTAWGVKRRRP